MSLRRVVITSCVLVAVGTVLAQTPQTPGTTIDPISGTWTGDIGLTDANRFPVAFELKYDGTGIAGSVKGPGTARLKTGHSIRRRTRSGSSSTWTMTGNRRHLSSRASR